jgi:hypothetical protein
VDYLPRAVLALLPEADPGNWPAEQHADCEHCPMISGRFDPWSFRPETKCCTAVPSWANFLAGRALRRGGRTRELVMARLQEPEGVSPWGIDPPPALDEKYTAESASTFGRDLDLRCPFFVGGEHSCGVWLDRSATCRTWWCKHEDGLGGAVAWSRLHQALAELESRLALWAIGEGDPPDEPATPDAWAAWFERAAAIVDRITDEEAASLDNRALRRFRGDLSGFVDARRLRRDRGIADVLVPSVTEMVRAGDDLLVTGYSSFDAVRVPSTVFAFLARLDGTRTWREALEGTGVDEAMVRELHRVEALRDPRGGDDLPYGVEMVDMDKWARATEKK